MRSQKNWGGTELKETVLWTNPSPTSGFSGGQTVTLSQPVSNFDMVYCKYRSSKSNATSFIAYFDESEFATASDAVNNSFMPIFCIYNSNYWTRRVYPSSSNNLSNLTITNCTVIGNSTTNNDNCIPIEIGGIKL